MMTERQMRELEVQVARYRVLEREVTDPLAAYLLHSIVLELEADLQVTHPYRPYGDPPASGVRKINVTEINVTE